MVWWVGWLDNSTWANNQMINQVSNIQVSNIQLPELLTMWEECARVKGPPPLPPLLPLISRSFPLVKNELILL